jgi:MSHA pilin protein MshC
MRAIHLETRANGFTLIELVTVIVILGVLAAIAGPRFFGENIFRVRGYADEVATALRYAQKISVASGCPVQVSAAPATGYTLRQRAASGGTCAASGAYTLDVKRPDGGDAYRGTPPSGVDLSSSATFTFDGSGAATPSAGTGMVLTVVGQSGSYSITVDAGTGLAVVKKAS